jgi:hypothetical protein
MASVWPTALAGIAPMSDYPVTSKDCLRSDRRSGHTDAGKLRVFIELFKVREVDFEDGNNQEKFLKLASSTVE